MNRSRTQRGDRNDTTARPLALVAALLTLLQ